MGDEVSRRSHTCATLLLAGGEHPKVVPERLGHSSTVMTMDVYSHVLPDMQEAGSRGQAGKAPLRSLTVTQKPVES